MSEQRIVVETLCEHNMVNEHYDSYFGAAHGTPTGKCPGGSRRIVELPDMEKLKEALRGRHIVHRTAGQRSVDEDNITAAARWVLNLESE